MRISDEERTRAVDELRRHCASGRLGIEDYAERVAEAFGAETLAELDGALRDLPRMRIPDPRRRPPILAPEAGSEPGEATATSSTTSRLTARLVLVASVVVLALGLVLLLVAQWVWGVVLVAAWLVGLVQGRAPLRRRG